MFDRFINKKYPDLNYDLISDFDHYPLMMNVTIPEPRKKKNKDIKITVADSPKAKLNPNAKSWTNSDAYTSQMV